MRVNDNDEYICRFDFSDSNREIKFVGYVSKLSESKYICTGGSEIYYKKNDIKIELSSKENDFEWLSVRDKNLVGSK
ncbi:toxR activated protein [Vibrio cholerae]|nr:toxR activated protein [Vibrio cholerae]